MKRCKKMIHVMLMVVMCAFAFICLGTCEAKAAKLTKAEKRQFSKYMNRGLEKDNFGSSVYHSKKQGLWYGPEFCVYDINGDGHKDVIATGILGLRTMSFSEVYLHANGKYIIIPIRGTVQAVSSKGIYSIEDDYTQAGAERYCSKIAYRIDKRGKVVSEYSYNTDKLFYDMNTRKEYKNGKLVSKSYLNKDGKKVSKTTYTNAVKKVNKKKVKWYPMTKANISRYLK